MKKYIITAFLLITIVMAQATIINVDNKANRPSGYANNLQAAVNNASSGDTIYLYPSNVDYGNININKKLYIFGFGYDGTNNYVARIDHLYLDTSATPSTTSSYSTIQGITISGGISCSKEKIKNISLIGNQFTYLSLHINCSSWIIKNNYITDYIYLNNNNSIIILNNTFDGSYYEPLRSSNSSSLVVSNNLFMYWSKFSNIQNATISNNIFICSSNSYTGGNMNSNTFTNNISYCSNTNNTYTLPPTGNTGSGNLQNTSPSFITGSTNSYYDYTLDYHLSSTSAAKDAGTDGTDIGPSGGTEPFIWGGAFSIPKVTQLSISNPIINQGTDINVNVKAKKAEL